MRQEKNTLWNLLEKSHCEISTDTRKDIPRTVFFAIKGENFDGNDFVEVALKKGVLGAVTDNPKNKSIKNKNVFFVKNVQEILEEVARTYRTFFNIPIIAIGGSNGKTTSKELIRVVLDKKYIVHSTEGSLNNHLGVPLSILAMKRESEIGIFEIGANHRAEHTHLLSILNPTHVVVTNNGMDHLEGFGSPKGVRKANAEIYDWAQAYRASSFVHTTHSDLVNDSKKVKRILYPNVTLKITGETPLSFTYKNKKYVTHLAGKYNIENIELALAIGEAFGIQTEEALQAISKYVSTSRRSQIITEKGNAYIIDCYNANPSSMKLALESFLTSTKSPRGILLGDMLELGTYAGKEHKKIVNFVLKQKLDCIVFVGKEFEKVLKKIKNKKAPYHWFPNSEAARVWFSTQQYKEYTFLLKGSRGIKMEKVIEK